MAHNKLKRDLRKGVSTNLDVNINRWECETYGAYCCLSRLCQSSKILCTATPRRCSTSTSEGNYKRFKHKVCKSIAALKRHMLVHKAVIPQKDEGHHEPCEDPNIGLLYLSSTL